MVVFRRHKDECIKGGDLRRPCLGMILGVLAHGWRHWLVQERQLKSLMSTSSNSASLRFCAISYAHLATVSPLRPGRVLPIMMATLSMISPDQSQVLQPSAQVDVPENRTRGGKSS